jgi:hypothetical protein
MAASDGRLLSISRRKRPPGGRFRTVFFSRRRMRRPVRGLRQNRAQGAATVAPVVPRKCQRKGWMRRGPTVAACGHDPREAGATRAGFGAPTTGLSPLWCPLGLHWTAETARNHLETGPERVGTAFLFCGFGGSAGIRRGSRRKWREDPEMIALVFRRKFNSRVQMRRGPINSVPCNNPPQARTGRTREWQRSRGECVSDHDGLTPSEP